MKSNNKIVACIICGILVKVNKRSDPKKVKCKLCKCYKKICPNCKKEFLAKRKHYTYCSLSCSMSFRLKNGFARELFLKKSKVNIKRSKNEIHFANLCIKHFGKDNILTNKNMFNGWDADVIILNKKVAILWNGPWHYKKITKSHSVKQVQNRDRIKIKEIKKSEYIPYSIKDISRGNDKEYVQKEFNKFIKTQQVMGSNPISAI